MEGTRAFYEDLQRKITQKTNPIRDVIHRFERRPRILFIFKEVSP